MSIGEADPPLLGIAGRWGTAEIDLAGRFDQLHQLIYTGGGIRPSNAAVEEVAKLALVRLWSLRNPSATLDGGTRAGDVFPDGTAEDFRHAFAQALASADLAAVDPAGRMYPVWPPDEPFRLTDAVVLRAAAVIIAEIIDHGRPSVADPLGAAFDALLAGRYDHAGGLGTYLTPSGVARMMAEIAVDMLAADPPDRPGRPDQPAAGGHGFGDPYCGTGRFLVAALEVLRDRPEPFARYLTASGLFGADQSASSVAKARINMMLYGVQRPLIWTVRDSVSDAAIAEFSGRVPLILTNPPFGEGKYDNPVGLSETRAAIPRLGGKGRIDPSLACLVKALRLLAPGGVLGVVLPDGVISSRTFADLVSGRGGDLAHRVGLAANVSLPTATFALSGTVAKTSAVFLRKDRRPRHVALARVEHVGYLRRAGRAAADPEGNELPAIPGLIHDGLSRADDATLTIESAEPLVAVAAAGSLHSLDPARLDPDAMHARRWLIDRGGIELRELLSARKALPAVRAAPPYVSILHVDDVGTVDWHSAAAHTPITPGLLVGEGDVIVSLLNPSKLRAAVIPAGVASVQVSGEFGVFRAACDPYAVLGILYSQWVRAQLTPLGRGTSSSRRRIDVEDVLSLIVPKLADGPLVELGRAVRDASALVAEGRERLWRLFEVDLSP